MKNNKSKTSCKRGFTLIEHLVVVLIIGILAAVALPQYQKAVEKSRMTEAIVNLQTIAKAHQLYFLENGEYVGPSDMEKLAISIPGEEDSTWNAGRIKTAYFIYAPNTVSNDSLANVRRISSDSSQPKVYYMYILQNDPNTIHCRVDSDSSASAIQKKLCEDLEEKGIL